MLAQQSSSRSSLEKECASEGRRTLALPMFMKQFSNPLIELSSPEVAHGPISNPNANKRSSMKNPERFNAFLSRCLDPRATVGPSLFRVTSRRLLRITSVNGQK